MARPLSTRSKLAVIASVLLLTGAAIFVAGSLKRTPASKPLLYKGKSVEVWFYGSRTNFFNQDTIDAAEKAFNALGTNAFPFLLGNLKGHPGQGVLYFKTYQALP